MLFIMYIIEYVFANNKIIFWSLLVMQQHLICIIKCQIFIVHFWSINSFHYCTLKYLSTWECMRIINVFHHLYHILCISYHDIFIHTVIGNDVAVSVNLFANMSTLEYMNISIFNSFLCHKLYFWYTVINVTIIHGDKAATYLCTFMHTDIIVYFHFIISFRYCTVILLSPL